MARSRLPSIARRVVVTVLLLIAAALSLSAQTASIQGTVVDSGGGVIPGATVTARRVDTANPAEVSTTTDQFGAFTIHVLQPGSYVVRVELRGFAVVERRVSVTVGSASTLRVVLDDSPAATAAPATPASAPPPPPPTAAPDEPPTLPAGAKAVVPVFYATDRKRLSGPLGYGPKRNPGGMLHLGRFDVSIPRDHRMARYERPTMWTLWREDPALHLTIVRRKQLSYKAFYDELRKTTSKSPLRQAFVFIHGFNVAFDDAVYRTAQIAYDLGFEGAPILYSWPSEASTSLIGYTTDAENNDWTVRHLRWFLEDVAAKSGAEQIHVIAHSMGNRALVRALELMPANGPQRFAKVFLTAPDIDTDTFIELAAAVKRNARMATLYASDGDRALMLSQTLQSYRRAGGVAGGVVIVEGLDTIDVSAVDSDFIGHSYYGDNRSVISDMLFVLDQSLPPARRPRIHAAGTVDARYWRLLPD